MNEKVILTDCDGVMLDWCYAFDRWMSRHGYRIKSTAEYDIGKRYDVGYADKKRLTRMFNESAAIRRVPPLRDAIKYIRKLHEEHGYVFHVITSMSDDEYAQHLRTKNLCETFGGTIFEKYIFLDCGADKDEALEPYKDTECYWIEDKPENADVGCKLGLNSVIMGHQYNANYKGEALRVQNWKEIYELITGN